MTLLIIYFVFSIAFSFLCSILEAVLLSITPSYISGKVQEGGGIGKSLEVFKEDIDRPLSAILTLNTIAHTVGAIMVGAQAGKVLGATNLTLGPIKLSGEAIVAGLMTLAILILSEIIPKTIGANYWRKLTPFSVSAIKFLLFILAPFVWLSQLITKNLKNNKGHSVFSRSDFSVMTRVGEESGALRQRESRTIRTLLRLDEIRVKSIMTPRSVMISTVEGKTLRDFYNSEMPIRYSRIPVFDKDKETISGVLLKDDLFQGLIEKKDDEVITSLIRKPVFINVDASLSELQDKLMETQDHIAVVTDEFGVILGIVTWEDLLETILGLEIVDETDDIEDLQIHARELWEKRREKV